ncbi:unnamed protein product, partial [Prorocentrum cordatum]
EAGPWGTVGPERVRSPGPRAAHLQEARGGAGGGSLRSSAAPRPRPSGASGACAAGGAGFRDRLEALAATHDLEVADLRGEVVDLRGGVIVLQNQVEQYRSLLHRAQDSFGRICGELPSAAGEWPAVSDLMQEIASEMAGEMQDVWGNAADGTPKASCCPSQVGVVATTPARSATQKRATAVALNSKLNKATSRQVSAVMPPAARRALTRNLYQQQKKIKGSSVNLDGTYLQRFVGHCSFDLVCACMIITNSIIIGVEVQWLTTHETELAATKILGLLCSCFFFIELVLRIVADGMRHFFVLSDNRNWNWFDCVLVVMSVFDGVSLADAGVAASTVGAGAGFKTIKILRIVRVVRVFRFFSKLSQLAFMIIDSVKSLMWALVLLGLVIYVFAIFFTHYTTEHIRRQGKGNTSIHIDEHFGNLWLTLFTLFHTMLNGISWYTLPSALYTIPGWTGPFLAFGFVCYLSFTMLVVMNIITGVFVDNAVQTAGTQREFLVQKEMEVKEQWRSEMRSIFLEMDADRSGTVSREEVSDFCNHERVQHYLTALGLDVHDTERLFELLDVNHDGELDVDEFLDGCLRLKGVARSIDVCSLIHQSRLLCRRVDGIDSTLRTHLGSARHPRRTLRSPSRAERPPSARSDPAGLAQQR